ncbi:MAG: DUF72 domain-containing protein [Desulfovibrionales bacterium]
MAVAYVGTSGYQYDHWKEIFYPKDLVKTRWFEHFTTRFATVEINATFYHLPKKTTFEKWQENSPDWFVYTLKYSRYGSHVKKLKDTPETISRFLKNAAPLKPQTGSILVQLPPGWNVNADRLRDFFQAAPKDYRWAFEFRNESWLCDEVYEILSRNNSALVIHDHIKPHPEVITADWVYLRFHGGDVGTGGYSPQKLSAVADSVRDHLDEGRDVFVYYNNDWDGHALYNAQDLIRFLRNRNAPVLLPFPSSSSR